MPTNVTVTKHAGIAHAAFSATTSEDVLVPVGARFSLGPASHDLAFSNAPPSDTGSRPFVLRVAGRPAPHRTATLPPARYCPTRQIAVSNDESSRPIWPLGYTKTTVGSKDGEHNPMEDWTPDK